MRERELIEERSERDRLINLRIALHNRAVREERDLAADEQLEWDALCSQIDELKRRELAAMPTPGQLRRRDPAITSTAHHEAGHAVAVAVLGYEIYEATIIPDDNRCGHVAHEPISSEADRACTTFAGPVAQAWHSRGWRGVDELSAFELERKGQWLSDGRRIHSAAAEHSRRAVTNRQQTTDVQRRQFVAAAKDRAFGILYRHRRAMDAIAEQLLDQGEIGGCEVRAVIERYAPAGFRFGQK